MNGNNTIFKADPFWYLKQRAINGVAWFMKGQTSIEFQMQNIILNNAKRGSFNLVEQPNSSEVIFTPVGNICNGYAHDTEINAYWCPFVQGHLLPGFVDIPLKNPEFHFVFTAAMNGCALVATRSPVSSDMIRIYHNQHPTSCGVNQMIMDQGEDLISYASFEDYGQETQGAIAPNAFNMLYYRNGLWKYILQPQTLDMVTHKVSIDPSHPPIIMDVTPR